jgi:hypothetical protein
VRPLDFGTGDEPSREPRDDSWAPVPGIVLFVLLLFFGLFQYALVRDIEMPRLIDNAFMPIHEAGHALFRPLGLTAAIAGGTFLQLFVPFALALYFMRQRQAQGVACCMFFVFEQCLPVARYMADARVQQLPQFTVGGYESVHDWNYLFTKLGVLSYDTEIADVVRFIGWVGMIGVTFWLFRRGLNDVYNAGTK